MADKDDIKRLISQYNRRLQILKEKEAQYGLEIPTSILTEIVNIEAKIDELLPFRFLKLVVPVASLLR